jgi:hypothetical protein
VELPMHQAYCTQFCNTMWWLRYAAHICNLLAPHHVIYVDANILIPSDSLVHDPVHLSVECAAQFIPRLGSLLGPDTAVLSAHSAAAPTQGSPRP